MSDAGRAAYEAYEAASAPPDERASWDIEPDSNRAAWDAAAQAAIGAAPGWPTCPDGCGCRLGTEDADARECACDGPCTIECRENGYPGAPSYRDLAVRHAMDESERLRAIIRDMAAAITAQMRGDSEIREAEVTDWLSRAGAGHDAGAEAQAATQPAVTVDALAAALAGRRILVRAGNGTELRPVARPRELAWQLLAAISPRPAGDPPAGAGPEDEAPGCRQARAALTIALDALQRVRLGPDDRLAAMAEDALAEADAALEGRQRRSGDRQNTAPGPQPGYPAP